MKKLIALIITTVALIAAPTFAEDKGWGEPAYQGDTSMCTSISADTLEGFLERNDCLQEYSYKFDHVLRRLALEGRENPAAAAQYEIYKTALYEAVEAYRVENDIQSFGGSYTQVDVVWVSVAMHLDETLVHLADYK